MTKPCQWLNQMGVAVTAYNPEGQVIGTRAFTYNDALQLVAETQISGLIPHPLTNLITRNYDGLGRITGFALTSELGPQTSVSYTYSDVGHFSGLSSVIGHQSSNSWTYFYLTNSDLLAGYDLSMAGAASLVTVAKSYEDNRNLITSVANSFGTNLVSRFDYLNDALGRRTQRIDTTGSVISNSFNYNDRSELIATEMGTNVFFWVLDNIGNRESTSKNGANRIFEANELNQYTSISNGELRTLLYDLDGNLTNDSVFAHTFNGENRLIMSVPVAVTNGSKRVQNAYGYQGRRFRKVVETWDGSSWVNATTNIFIYDAFTLIQEQNATSGVLRSYVRGLDLSGTLQGAGGTGGLLAMISGNNTYFYLGDANGNVTELVDTNGEIVVHCEWDAYGNRLNALGENEPENPFGFSSQYRDQETSFDMYIFRPYSSELERWINRDPIGERGGVPLYGYCGNGGLNPIDYLGLAWTGNIGENGGTLKYETSPISLDLLGGYIGRVDINGSGEATFRTASLTKANCHGPFGEPVTIKKESKLEAFPPSLVFINTKIFGERGKYVESQKWSFYLVYLVLDMDISASDKGYTWSDKFCKCFERMVTINAKGSCLLNVPGTFAIAYAFAEALEIALEKLPDLKIPLPNSNLPPITLPAM